LNASVSMTDKQEIVAPTDYQDLSDVISTADVETIKAIVESKRLQVVAQTVFGGKSLVVTLTVDLSDMQNVVASGNVTYDAAHFDVIFAESRFYVVKDNIRLTFSVETALKYLAKFVDLPQVEDGSILQDLSAATAHDGKLWVQIGQIAGNVDLAELQATLDLLDTQATLCVSATDKQVATPFGEYSALDDLDHLVDAVRQEIDASTFNLSGEFTWHETAIGLENVRIINKDKSVPFGQSFDDGNLLIAGTLVLKNKNNVPIDVTYVDHTLYVVYNNALNLKFSRESLDSIIATVKDNLKIVSNVMMIAGYDMRDVFDKTDDVEGKLQLNLSAVVDMIDAFSADVNKVSLGMDFAAFDSHVTVDAWWADGLYAYVSSKDLTLSLQLNDELPLDITAPSGSFIDASNLSKLVSSFMVTADKEPLTYTLKGGANIKMDSALLSLIAGSNINATVDRVTIKTTDDFKLEAYVSFNFYETAVSSTDLIRSTVHDSFITFGKAELWYKDGVIYIARTNRKYTTSGFIIKKYKWSNATTQYRAMTLEYFSQHVIDTISFFSGLSSSLAKEINDSINQNIRPEKLILGYKYASSTHTLTVDGNELSTSGMIKNIDVTMKESATDVGNMLTAFGANIPISFLSMNMTVNVNLSYYKDDVDTAKLDSLDPSSFGAVRQ